MRQALIYGAGAIGRGFLPLMIKDEFRIDFAETDPGIRKLLGSRDSYETAISEHTHYRFDRVPYDEVFEDRNMPLDKYDAVFLSVGCGACLDLKADLGSAKNIFVLENDKDLVQRIKETYSNDRVFFAIPDVITSNAAPKALLYMDPLCLVTEKGRLIVQDGDYDFFHDQKVQDKELDTHWACKFFIHNAPHAIAAYLGASDGCEYIHEAMAKPAIGETVESAMQAITDSLIAAGRVPESMGKEYMTNELGRFRDKLLYDPIKRVARDPLRKLDKNNRLVQSLHRVLEAGYDPEPVMIGIRSALDYLNGDSFAVLRSVSGITDSSLIKRIVGNGLTQASCIEQS
jgi:mannitol-1-phosphate 5-dehydrogenase